MIGTFYVLLNTTMNSFLIIAAIASSQTCTISNIETQKVFAGRLGYKISTTLTVQCDGKNQTVKISPYHTVPSHNVSFKIGQKVIFARGMKGKVSLSDIKY